MPTEKSGITDIIKKSLKTTKPFFVLSAFPTSELDAIAEQRAAIWQQSGKQNKTENNLAVLAFSFPWSENPAHSLFAQIIEHWKPEDLKALVQNQLGWGYHTDKVTTNAHLADVLKGIIHPGHSGDGDLWEKRRLMDAEKILSNLHRTYLLDPTSQASDRRKLGYARPLTTQDRYELLTCLFRCWQGLDGERPHTRIWFTLNQAERLLEYSPAEQKLLVHGFTTLITQLPEHFTFWINIADPDPNIPAKVKKACGALLWQWLDHEFIRTVVEGDAEPVD